ncbi:MAG TPA: hypothetical protein VEQ17_05055 [Steroidobacteraceae bacterium]|nr:hypothetical protein [Steroidobacteraceae bacterium]
MIGFNPNAPTKIDLRRSAETGQMILVVSQYQPEGGELAYARRVATDGGRNTPIQAWELAASLRAIADAISPLPPDETEIVSFSGPRGFSNQR